MKEIFEQAVETQQSWNQKTVNLLMSLWSDCVTPEQAVEALKQTNLEFTMHHLELPVEVVEVMFKAWDLDANK